MKCVVCSEAECEVGKLRCDACKAKADRYKHARSGYRYISQHVQVNHPESFFHGEKGTIVAQGRWGYWIVRIVKNDEAFMPEIARGYLEPVQEGEEQHA